MLSLKTAFIFSAAMGAVIFFCRLFPFIFFRKDAALKKNTATGKFLSFVERTAPPVAMTVLTFNAISSPVIENLSGFAFPVLSASFLTAVLHLWKRNVLLSIFAGTLYYMLIIRF